ncbi:MAG: TIGR02391 family protein [Firmicutes bacterium]|nr:TIGR02391 family protein [Bacillota bacterium]
MQTKYENELISLRNWINNANSNLELARRVTTDLSSKNTICYQINAIADGIANEYPFYATQLKMISENLFKHSIYGAIVLNAAVFGELVIIIRHIIKEPINMSIWQEIHPRIVSISQDLFCDRYYDSAAEKAVKEVESRLRELFQQLKPGSAVPAKVGDIIGALLTENGAYHFSDLSTTSGKDYRRGIQSLFEGIFAAYRNPSAHENIPCTKREAMEQIMLASQLMYVLDKD